MRVICLLLGLSFSLNLTAQERTIEGIVTEMDGAKAIPNAYIFAKGTEFGTRTDGQGRFVLVDVPGEITHLTVQSYGYNTKDVLVSDDQEQAISLEENVLNLPQLVVESQSLALGHVGMREIPGSVHYISAAELNNFNFTNVNDVLKMVPGVNIQEEDGYGLRPNIGLRGTSLERSARITIMEDGILAAPAPYSSPSAYYFPTIGRMNSVEVLKGASQIRFGPFTTGGAINFQSTPIPSAFSSKMQLSAGSFGFRSLHAHVGTSGRNVGFVAETFQYGADGFKTLPNDGDTGFDKEDYQVKVRVNTNPDAKIYQSLSMMLGQTKETSNETYLGLAQQDFDRDPYQRYASSQVDKMSAEQTRVSMQHYLELPGWFNVVTTAYRNDFSRNWYKLQSIVDGPSIGSVLDNPIAYSREYDLLRGIGDSDTASFNVRANNREYYSQGVQTVFDIEFGDGAVSHDLHISGRFHQDQEDRFQWEDGYAMNNGVMKLVDPGTPGTQANRIETADAFAAYAFYKLSFGDWNVTPGVRYEHVRVSREDYGREDIERSGRDLSTRQNTFDAWLPGLGVNYELSAQVNVFGGVHRGFAPTGSSPDTDPESSTNYEIGIRKYEGFMTGSVTFFANDYDNLLGRDIAAAGGIGSGDAFNAGEALTQGIESELQLNFAHVELGLATPLTLSYTFTDSHFSDDFESDFDQWGSVQSGDELPYIARHQFQARWGVQNRQFGVFANFKYQSDVRIAPGSGEIPENELIPAFSTVDLSANYYFSKVFTVNFSLMNAFDNQFAVAARPLGLRPGMPRNFNLGIKASF